MNELENDRFKDQWQRALGDAEMDPPEAVWTQVDREVARGSAQKYRRQAFAYKWAAMIAVLLAAVYAFLELTILNTNPQSQGAGEFFTIHTTLQGFTPDVREKEEETITQLATGNKGGADDRLNGGEAFGYGNTPVTPSEFEVLDLDGRGIATIATSEIEAPELYRVPMYTWVPTSKTSSAERMWAGLGVGTSMFAPNYQSHTNPVTTAVNTSKANFLNTGRPSQERTVSESMNAGLNRQVGLNVGFRLSRVTIESGLVYAMAQVENTSNVVITNRYFPQPVALTSEAASDPQVNSIASQEEIVEYEYEDTKMNNTFQFASVPVRAGFILIDNRLNMRLNAGVITSFYLGNEVKSPSGEVASLEFKPGKESPYREMNFSGQAGISLGYRLLHSLDLTVEPNYTHSLHSITKTSSTFSTTPAGFGVMAGLRYNFR